MSAYKDKRTGKIRLDPETSRYVKCGLKNAKELKTTIERLKDNFARLGISVRKAHEAISFYQI